jgi:hypothetical protein
MLRSLRWACVPILALFAAAAAAEFHTFRIDELFSNSDGTIQYVVLHESAHMNGENLLTMAQLFSTSAGVTKTFLFPKDLPGGTCNLYSCMDSPTADKRVLIGTAGFAALHAVTPDYVMPNGFLATDGGSVSYSGLDNVTYLALPTDGVTALFMDGTTSRNLATNFAGASGTVPAGPTTVTVVEYHHALFDHYFITPVPDEIALLDARTPPFQDWSRTGFSFSAYMNATAPVGSVAICRFFNDHFAPKSSHFYAAHGFGCEATLALFPDWGLEDDKLFNTMLPDTNGVCPAGTIPVYRLYNNGMGAAPNHRFVTSLAERQKMIDLGFVPEGAGIGVGMCVPG